jgi:membrane protein implicated in regulation of membrane protease activity
VEFALAFVVLAIAVALVVVRPLRRGDELEVEDQRRAALEAAKEAKYREIRDAELDREMGKLSDEDWRAVDRDLRAQAIEILRELDELGEPDGPAGAAGPSPRS